MPATTLAGLDPTQTAPLQRTAIETPDFSAVILVGTGENLYPFNQGTNVLPKALMPVGNVAVISLVMDWVFAAGLTDILIIVPPSAETALSEFLRQSYSSGSHPRARITLKTYDDAGDDDEGDAPVDERVDTAQLLRRFRSFIKSDFVLLPCDISFPSSLTLASILDMHRSTTDAVCTALLYEAPEPVKENEEKLLAGMDPDTHELLLLQGLDTLEDELDLRMGLLEQHPRLKLSTRLLDAHVYVFRRTVLDLLATRRSRDLSSVREQFVPWLVKGAWQEGLGREWTPILCPPNYDPLATALSRSLSMPYNKAKLLQPATAPGSAQSDHTPLPDTEPSAGESLAAFKNGLVAKKRTTPAKPAVPWTCRVLVAKPVVPEAPAAAKPATKGKPAAEPEAEYVLRANSLPGYWEMNRRLVRSLAAAYAAAGGAASGAPAPAGGAGSDEIAGSAQISPDSLVGEGSRVGERASIKKCVVGRHCNIGRGAKLTGCVLWDWVTVEDNVRLENVILCGNVRIGEKANIKDCELGPGFEALPGVTLKGERLIAGQEA